MNRPPWRGATGPAGPAGQWLRRVLGAGPTEERWTPPANVLCHADLPYGRWPAQRLDLYAPAAASAAPRPVMVWVHGGGWVAGDKARPAMVQHKVQHWLPRGWLLVSLNYRLLPRATPVEQADDVAQALDVVQRQVHRWGGDAQRVVLMGHSTGAHLAALVLGRRSAQRSPLPPLQAAVLVDTAALDVVGLMRGEHLPLHERAFGADPAQWTAASPWHALQGALPPCLLLHAADRPESAAQNQAYAERARQWGSAVQVQALALGHQALNEQLGQPGEATAAVDGFLQAQGLP
ncbi:MAG: alpha/beta hydrolase [Rubrivivax sp.]|jgi:arylformamidase